MARMECESYVPDIAFSPDGKWIVSGTEDGMVQVWGSSHGTRNHTHNARRNYKCRGFQSGWRMDSFCRKI